MKKLNKYCERHTTPPSAILHELERETFLHTLSPQMISGHLQGQLLTMLSHLINPKLILEIGTFTGYAAICLAQGLKENGLLHTIEVNPEYTHISRKFLEKAGLLNKIIPHFGDAREIIPTLPDGFDMVFLDAAKQDYAFYYDLVFDKIKPGGLLLADNVLWGGKVIAGATDKDTQLMEAFNQKIQDDIRVENVMLPLRDGLFLVRKK